METTVKRREGKKRDWVRKEDIPQGCALLKGTPRVDYLVSPHGEVFGHDLRTDRIFKMRPYEAVYAVHTMTRTYYEKTGYQKLSLTILGKELKFFVHRLVAMFFCPNDAPTRKRIVDHKDGNRKNNDYTNLEWVTREENQRRLVESKGWKELSDKAKANARNHKRRTQEAHRLRKQRLQDSNLFNE